MFSVFRLFSFSVLLRSISSDKGIAPRNLFTARFPILARPMSLALVESDLWVLAETKPPSADRIGHAKHRCIFRYIGATVVLTLILKP